MRRAGVHLVRQGPGRDEASTDNRLDVLRLNDTPSKGPELQSNGLRFTPDGDSNHARRITDGRRLLIALTRTRSTGPARVGPIDAPRSLGVSP